MLSLICLLGMPGPTFSIFVLKVIWFMLTIAILLVKENFVRIPAGSTSIIKIWAYLIRNSFITLEWIFKNLLESIPLACWFTKNIQVKSFFFNPPSLRGSCVRTFLFLRTLIDWTVCCVYEKLGGVLFFVQTFFERFLILLFIVSPLRL